MTLNALGSWRNRAAVVQKSLAAVVLVGANHSVWADIDERYKVSVGVSITTFDSGMAISGVGDEGKSVNIDLENDLGYDSSVSIGWLQGQMNIAGKHSVRAEFLPLRRSADNVLKEDIEYDGKIISADAVVHSEFNTFIYDVSYLYGIYQKPNFKVDLAAGLYVMEMSTKLQANGDIRSDDGVNSFENSYEGKKSFTAPLPLVGVFTEYEITPHWRVNANLRYLAVSVGSTDGSLLSANAGATYYFNDSWGAGLSVGTFGLDVEVEKARAVGNFEWSYSGAQLFLAAKF